MDFLIRMSERNGVPIWPEGRLLENSAVIAGILIFLFCIIRLAWMSGLSETELIKFIPDDAFYYLVLAKNFSIERRWTFDGQAPASGFHLLWGYLLAAVFTALPTITWKAVFVAMGVLGCAAYSIAAFLVACTVRRLVGAPSVCGVVFVFLGASSIIQPVMLMEAPLVTLFSALLFFIAFHETSCVRVAYILFAAAVGFLGMLSRSDFGLLPLILLCVSAFLRAPRMARVSLSALLGALIGLVFVIIHTYSLSGELAPASAQIKNHWAQVDGISIRPGYKILLALVVPSFRCWEEGLQGQYGFLLLLILLGVCVYVALTHENRRSIFTACISVVLLIVGYLFFYRYNGALQIWYAVNFLVPLSVLFGIAASVVCFRWPTLAVFTVFVLSIYSWCLSISAPWPWQSSMLKGGLYLKEHPVEGVVGAWNAGIISYFSERHIVNLDGLVNDEILQYVKSDRFSDYVAERQISYIMDFPLMLSNAVSESHGYSDGKLLSCLAVGHKIPSASPAEQFGGELTLYRVRYGCLR